MTWTRPLAAVVLAFLAAAPARAESLAEQVTCAIDRGVVAARRSLGADGAGNTRYHGTYAVGDTALVLYTLVKSGVSPVDPQVTKALEWMRYQPLTKTYSAAVYVLALDCLGGREYDPQIQAGGKWLEDQFNVKAGRWAYPDSTTDLSNTQYAALALWAAERHGFKAKVETWAGLLRGVPEFERPGGGFGYHADHDQTGSMTVAGLTALHLALDRVPDADPRFREDRRRAKAAVERAWAYLEGNFRLDRDLHGPHGTRYGWHLYYLYGVERLAALTGKDRIAGRDWYAEGARVLLGAQRADGSWGDPWDTCFALLFLRRATFTSMGGTSKGPEGEGVTSAPAGPAPVRPGWDVRWMRRWLVLGPVPDPRDELFENPPFKPGTAAAIVGQTVAGARWRVLETRRNHVAPSDPEPPARSMAWAFTYLHVAADTDAVLWFGNDDGLRIFLDGSLVFDHHVHEGDQWDSHHLPLRLAAGARRLMIQLENWSGPTHFWMRMAHPDGSACAEVRPSLRSDASDLAESALAQPGQFTLDELLRLLPRSRTTELTFDTEDQLDRIATEGDANPYPVWRGEPGDAKSRGPSPGGFGFLGMHPDGLTGWMRAYWKVRVPEKPSKIRVRASATISAPGRADTVLRVRAYDGAAAGKETALLSVVVGPDAKPDASNWKWFEADLAGFEGRDVLFVLETVNGGREWFYEDLWIDAVEVRPAP